MIFGNKSQFAIEAQTELQDDHLFGFICFWLDKQQIGDPEQLVVLNVSSAFLEMFIAATGTRQDPALNDTSPIDAIRELDRLERVSEHASYSELARANRKYGPFYLCPGPGEAFDGELVIVIETPIGLRVIWRRWQEIAVHEMLLSHTDLETPIREFIEWTNEQSSKLRS